MKNKISINSDYSLSDKFATLVQNLGITYAELAQKSGMGKPDKLYNMKAGRSNLSFESIWKIANAFPETNVNFLFGIEDNPLRDAQMIALKHPNKRIHKR